MALWSDFVNVPPLQSFGLDQDQELPSELERQNDETLATWRDRIYQAYRIPVGLAALSDLKTPFVEIANPLLSRSLINITRELSDSERTEKKLFRKIVQDVSPKVPFAKHKSTLTLDGVLKLPAVADYLREILHLTSDRYSLPGQFVRFAKNEISAESIETTTKKFQLQSTLRRLLPAKAKNLLQRSIIGTKLDGNIIAFRCVMIILMQDRLNALAKLGAGRLNRYGELPSE